MYSPLSTEHGIPDEELETVKLDLKLVRKLIDIGRVLNQSGQTILNVIYQCEWIIQFQVDSGAITERECSTKIGATQIIGCYLLSSKYFESGHLHILIPSALQRVFPSFSKQEICVMEMECAKVLRYRVDKLLLKQYNFWVVVDYIIFDFKAQFKLTEKYYLKFCKFCQDIAVDLMYHLGSCGVDTFDTESLAAAIIVCAFNRINVHHTISRVIRHLVDISQYNTPEELLKSAEEIETLLQPKTSPYSVISCESPQQIKN